MHTKPVFLYLRNNNVWLLSTQSMAVAEHPICAAEIDLDVGYTHHRRPADKLVAEFVHAAKDLPPADESDVVVEQVVTRLLERDQSQAPEGGAQRPGIATRRGARVCQRQVDSVEALPGI